MKISTSTFGVIGTYGLEDGLKMLANAGFEAIDYSITQNAMNWEDPLFQDVSHAAFAEHFKKTAKIVRGSGLHIDKLCLDTGDLEVRGWIDSLEYQDTKAQSGGLLRRLFG